MTEDIAVLDAQMGYLEIIKLENVKPIVTQLITLLLIRQQTFVWVLAPSDFLLSIQQLNVEEIAQVYMQIQQQENVYNNAQGHKDYMLIPPQILVSISVLLVGMEIVIDGSVKPPALMLLQVTYYKYKDCV